jgi:hypothetical protein
MKSIIAMAWTGAGVNFQNGGTNSGGVNGHIAAVYNSGGIVVGNFAGVNFDHVNNVSSGPMSPDLYVNNNKGLILANGNSWGNGVSVNNSGGIADPSGGRTANVTIDNRNTLSGSGSTFDYAALDGNGDPIYDQDSDLSASLYALHDAYNNYLGNQLGLNLPNDIMPKGIFGTGNGIDISNVGDGYVSIDNSNGLIGGLSGDGIHVRHAGTVDIYNSGGVVAGASGSGINTDRVAHLHVGNRNGAIFGSGNGVDAYKTEDYVFVANSGGIIKATGNSGDGIHINQIQFMPY